MPTKKLHVQGDIYTTGDISVNTISGLSTLTVTGNSYLATTSGNLGIGTTAPKANLQVDTSSNPTSIPALGTGNSTFGVTYGNGRGILMGNLNTGVGYIQVQRTDGTATAYDLVLQTNAGNIGIGTTGPIRRLDVVGASGVGIGTSAAGDVLIISSAGNVGIGTAAPLNKLDVSGKVRVAETAYFDAEYDNGSKTGAFTVDWNNGNKQKVTITGASLGVTFTAPPGPCNLLLKIVQGDGSDTLSWTTVPKWPSGTTPTLTVASGATDVISLYYDGTNYYGLASLNFQ